MPLLFDLLTWMQAQRRRLPTKSDLAKPLQFAMGRWKALIWSTTDGRLVIDKNVVERVLRGIAVTRKNFLFLVSDRGGERTATIYTALQPSRLNGFDHEVWLADVIERLTRRFGPRQID